jgi:hypothetical protein
MKIRRASFNLYLIVLICPLLLAIACETSAERKKSKEASTLRLFLEVPNTGSERLTGGVSIYRQSPLLLSLDREPFLTEADLDDASVVDAPGGFMIRAQFNGHAAMILENVTVSHKGQHIAVQSFFGQTRWLAAPVINRRIPNGELVFTPDATREEADRIVRGLTNVVKKIKKKEDGF